MMTPWTKLPVPLLALGLALAYAPTPAAAALIDGYTGIFALLPAATALSENDVGTTNPSFTFPNVPTYGTVTVSFGPYFTGQSYAFDLNTQPIPVQTGNTAANPLRLATSDPDLSAIIEDDASAPRNPVVGGSIDGTFSFVGPIAILFSVPVKAFELTVGQFSDANQIILEGFAADGSSLGSLQNGIAGFQQFDLSSDLGPISGLSLRSADGQSPTFIGVSGLGVFAGETTVPIPAPGASALIAALAGIGWCRRARRARQHAI